MNTWKTPARTVRGVAFSPDGKLLATHGEGDTFARVWDPVTRKEVAAFETPVERSATLEPMIDCVAFSHCGRYIAVGSSSVGRQGLRVWELATGKVVAPSLVMSDAPMGIAFTPGERPGLLVADGTRLNHFANALDPTGTAQPEAFGRGPDRASPKCSRVYLSPDLKLVATNGKSRAVVWDARTLKGLHARPHPRGPQNGPAAFDPAGEVLAVAHGTKVDLWPFADSDAEVIELAGHKLPVWAVGFLPDGRTVQTASSDGTVRLWDRATGTERGRYDFGIGKVYAAAFAPDGLTCAAGGENGQVVIWDVEA
jgi:WD40 repeat protein